MIYCFDIDGTICTTVIDSKYENAIPYKEAIDEVNSLYRSGHTILVMTARGSVSGKDWTDLTAKQLEEWGLKYHKLIMHQKPHADVFVDDKAINAVDWRNSLLKEDS